MIRHGMTEANEQHLYCGSTDLPLSGNGLAALHKRVIPPVTVPIFVTSGMKRCQQTLEALFGQVPCTIEADLREVDFGAFEMRSFEELQHNPDYQCWISGDNEENVPPGGESGSQMKKRVWQVMKNRILPTEGDIVVITHGGVIAALMAILFPQEGKNRYQWQPSPGGGYCLECSEQIPDSYWEL